MLTTLLTTLLLAADPLSLDERGRVWVTSRTGKQLLAEAGRITFPPGEPTPWRCGLAHRVRFVNGDELTAELLALDGNVLNVRTAWAESLQVPRSAVESITQLPGRRLLIADSFEPTNPAWRWRFSEAIAGPASHGSRSLALRAGGLAELRFAKAVSAGTFGINFHEPIDLASGRWRVEADFTGGLGRAELSAGPTYTATGPSKADVAAGLKRSPGWHRLEVEWHADSLIISVDDRVIWASLTSGPGAVQAVRLSREGGSAELRFDEFTFTDEKPLPSIPYGGQQDTIVDIEGDEWFAPLVGLNRENVRTVGRAMAWPQVAALHFARGRPTLANTTGETVLAESRSLAGTLDVLQGSVRGLDDTFLRLQHAILGEVRLPRSRLATLKAGTPWRP